MSKQPGFVIMRSCVVWYTFVSCQHRVHKLEVLPRQTKRHSGTDTFRKLA